MKIKNLIFLLALTSSIFALSASPNQAKAWNQVSIDKIDLETLITFFYRTNKSINTTYAYHYRSTPYVKFYNNLSEKNYLYVREFRTHVDSEGAAHQKESIESLKLLKNIKYTNSKGDQMYLVIVEGQGHTKNTDRSLTLDTCGACTPNVDIYLFKKEKDQNFHLITRSDHTRPIITGSNGVSGFSDSKNYSLENISPTEKVIFVKYESSQMGDEVKGISPILILEDRNKVIAQSENIETSANNGGSARDEAHQYYYDSEYFIAKDNLDNKFYPIIVSSKGSNYDEASNSIIPYNIQRIYQVQGNRYVISKNRP